MKKKSGGGQPPFASMGKNPEPPIRGIEFRDVFLREGRIASQHKHDSKTLVPSALEWCRRALVELRREALISTPIVGIGFSLGLPDVLLDSLTPETADNARRVGRYFCCHAGQAENPFLLNAVLVGDESPLSMTASPADLMESEMSGEASDGWVLATLIGLSAMQLGVEMASQEAQEALFADVMMRRPCLVSVHFPLGLAPVMTGPNLRDIVSTGADAATCMAAVLLHDHAEIPLPRVPTRPR